MPSCFIVKWTQLGETAFMIRSYNCPNCGAPLDNSAIIQMVASCAYCQTVFRIHQTNTPEPTLGDVLLAADFSAKPMPGWSFLNEDKTSLLNGAMVARFPPGPLVYHVLRSSGWFDDADVSVTIRFLEGVEKQIDAGVFVRYTAEKGGYGIFVSAQQTYQIGYYHKPGDEFQWVTLINWTEHHALKGGPNQPNRVRVLTQGKRLSVYLNGVLATSFEDPLYQRGMIRLSVEPTEKSNIVASFSDLQVRAVFKA